MFADRTHWVSALGCGPAIDWFSFENSFSNLLSGWDARPLFTAGQSCCECPAGMGIELWTFFQHVKQGKWGVLPGAVLVSEIVRSDDAWGDLRESCATCPVKYPG